jgi:hypothetical protein
MRSNGMASGVTPLATLAGRAPKRRGSQIGNDNTWNMEHEEILHWSVHRISLSLASYAVFFVTFLYAVGFVSGLAVPKTIDTGTVVPRAEAFVVNLLLMSALPFSTA